MTLGTGIVLGGFAYAIACRLSDGVTELGITRGRKMASWCLVLGIAVDMLGIAVDLFAAV